LDKDQFTEEERADAQEEQKRRAEENKEVQNETKHFFFSFIIRFRMVAKKVRNRRAKVPVVLMLMKKNKLRSFFLFSFFV